MEPPTQESEQELLEHHKITGLDQVEIQEVQVLERRMLSKWCGHIIEKLLATKAQSQKAGLYLILHDSS